MVSSQVLAAMKTQAYRFLTDTCDIHVRQNSTDAYGYQTQDYSAAYTNVMCRLILSGRGATNPAEIGEQERLVEEYRLSLKADQTIDVDDRVVLNGITYEVTGLITALTDKFFQMVEIRRER